MAAKKKKKQTVVCEGIVLSESVYKREENRLLTILLKGFIVYLLSMGSVGFYLSALDIKYNVLLCHVVISIMAFLCALLYYRLLVENLGYLVLLVGFAGIVYLLRYYINSGFYAIVNITVQNASEYFEVDIQKLYTEVITDRYITVTCLALFVGIVMDVFLNVYISRRMQYGMAVFAVLFLNVIPLYMTEEPSLLYSTMILIGVALAYVYKSSRHYSPQISTKRNNRVFTERGRGKNKELAYVYDIKALLSAGIFVATLVFAVVAVVNVFWPKETFNSGYKMNKYKELTMAAVGTLLVDGIEGFYRSSEDVGGMNGGRLGDVSSIHLDHQTDLVVQMTPYNYERVYLRAFIGETYNPYENTWTNLYKLKWADRDLTPEADALQESYENGDANSAKAVMSIRNVGANPENTYLPYYYSLPIDKDKMGNDIITYYPRLEENKTAMLEKYYGEVGSVRPEDLEIPEENKEAIAGLAEELQLEDRSEQMVLDSVNEYFQENIPYTIRPGRTPGKADFINYFLTENRKGYCAHYASAATLLFRYYGIPARYVEGYAIDYNQITMGELVEDAEYSDYYDGYSKLGETALVEINVTDADAHAWVEIYSKEKGWHPVEVTPAGEVEETEDFWTAFDRFTNDSDDDEEDGSSGGISVSVSDSLIKKIGIALFAILVVAILLFLCKIGLAQIVFMIRFKRASMNDRLIMYYSRFRIKRARYDKEFLKCLNYREQLLYLVAKREQKQKETLNSDEIEYMIAMLEQAGFSNCQISDADYQRVIKDMGRL